MTVQPYVLKEKEKMIALRRWFHQHPEPSLEEFATCDKIEQELDAYGIAHERIAPTAVYAHIVGKKGPGKIIVLRSDIDALRMADLKDVPYKSQNPECAHACGHDAHTTILLTAAKLLKQKEAEFAGEVRFFFQPAEEIGAGARLFVNKGLLDGVGRVYGAHISSILDSGKIALTPGPMNASCDYFKIEITGRGAHVSTPEKGIDALFIASSIVCNLQSIVARNTSPLNTVVVGIGCLDAGTQYNIVAEHATIEGTTRCFDMETRHKTNQMVTDIAKSIAEPYGAKVDVTFKDFAAPLINNEEAVEEVKSIAKNIYGEENIVTNFEKALCADDFADYLLKVKGMYGFVGTRNPNNPNTAVAQHHGLFDIDEDAMLASCELYVEYALAYLNGQFGD